MSIVRFRPRQLFYPSELQQLQTEMNELIENVFSGVMAPEGVTGAVTERVWTPALDVFEDQEKVVVRCDLPGMEQKDIDISLVEHTLTIRGEKRQEGEVKERNYHRVERLSGTFTRSLTLPATVDATKVTAQYTNGVLEITLPKLEEARPRQIKVTVT